MLPVRIVASREDWHGAFCCEGSAYEFDRAYSKSEFDNWTRYLQNLGASREEAIETLKFGRADSPSQAAEKCAGAVSSSDVTAAGLMAELAKVLGG